MSKSDIPEAILAKHPELARVEEALNSYREGTPIAARCAICDQPLTLTEIDATGELWITCATGCTSFRARRQPK